MQDQKKSASEFSARTDELAQKLQLSLRQLPAVVGISPAMLFAYRSGKRIPTLKALGKLSEAERRSESGRLDGNESEQGSARQLNEYLKLIKTCSDEAMRLAGGDPDKAAPIFDRMLAVWRETRASMAGSDPAGLIAAAEAKADSSLGRAARPGSKAA